jgi:hypothetical protein
MQRAGFSRRDVLGAAVGALTVGAALAEPLKAAHAAERATPDC